MKSELNSFVVSVMLLFTSIYCSQAKCSGLLKQGQPGSHDRIVFRRVLGIGTFGQVFLGWDGVLQHHVAIKVYEFGKTTITDMIKEISIVQRVCHRNNVELLHVVRQSLTGYPALIFEFVSERTLYETIAVLTSEEVPSFAHQILLGIDHAHSVGVVHNDLKPENIMIARDRQVLKIIDWGLGEIYNKDADQILAGTMQYQAPEMLLSYPHSWYAGDMWAFGCTFGGMIMNQPVLFWGQTIPEQLTIIAKVLGTEGLISMARKYQLDLNVSELPADLPSAATPWHQLVPPGRERFATPEALDLLSKLLKYDPAERLTAAQALAHPYFAPTRTGSLDQEKERTMILKIYFNDSQTA